MITSSQLYKNQNDKSKSKKVVSRLSSRSINLFSRPNSTSRKSKSSSSSSSNSDMETKLKKNIGESALLNYQDLCQKTSKMVEKHNLDGKLIKSPLLSYLSEIDKSKVSPKGFGLVHRKNRNEINIGSFYLNDGYIDAFSKAINLTKHVNKLNLSRNQLTSNRLIKILSMIPKTLRELNLSNNPNLTIEAYQVLCEQVIENNQYKLEKLILEGCKINDQTVKVIANSIEYNHSLRFLDLSKNEIKENGAKEIGQMITNNNSLAVLFLHWNKLQSKGGSYIAKAMSKNVNIQILDMSFCSLGSGKENQEIVLKLQVYKLIFLLKGINCLLTVDKVSKVTIEGAAKRGLEQLNIKIKNITKVKANSQAQDWRDFFLQNNKLVHLDLSQNGFCKQEVEIMSEGLKENHTILGIHMLGNEATTDALGFVIPATNEAIDESKNHIFTRIKPSLETGHVKNKNLIKLQASSNCWICEGWTEFKFTFKPKENIDSETVPIQLHLSSDIYNGELLEKDSITVDGETIFQTTRMLPPGEITYYYSINGQQELNDEENAIDSSKTMKSKKLQKLNVPKTNIIENVIQTNQLITQTYLTDMRCIPRPPPKNLKGREKLKTPWDFFKSVFRDYKPDNEALLNDCFEFDWSSSKIEKIIKGEEEVIKCKNYLKSVYQHLRETYKFFSAVDPVGLICSIGTNIYTEILNNCNDFNDGKTLKISDLDLEFVATNSGQKKQNPRNPERQLVRYQLMEVLVRRQYKTVQALFNKFSGKYALPGQQKYVSLDEFVEMVTSSGVVDDSFGSREIGPLFNLSMMTQRNELDFERHYNMTMPEFIEAIGRVADKLTNLPDLFPELVSQNKFKLDKKIESFLMVLCRNCLPKSSADALEKQLKKAIEEELSQPKRTKFNVLNKKY